MNDFVSTLRPGDPVKVAGRQGNFRFLKFYGEDSANVIGPIGGAGENEKTVRLVLLRKPPKTVTRKTVAINALAVEISEAAHKRG